MRKIVVAVAPVSLHPTDRVKNPLTPEDISNDVILSAKEGASMVHLHVRDLQGRPSKDLTVFTHTIDLIRKSTNIVIQGSTGGVSDLSLEERCVSLKEPRVEVGSLNMGSANFDEGVYINTLPDIRYWAKSMKEESVVPELEIFEGGMVNNSLILAEEGYLCFPFVFGFAVGFRGAQPANSDTLHYLKGIIPQGSLWGVAHHDMADFSVLAAAIGMGASFVRVGFEDSIYYSPGKAAKTNNELVGRIVKLIRDVGLEVAAPNEVRSLLGIQPVF